MGDVHVTARPTRVTRRQQLAARAVGLLPSPYARARGYLWLALAAIAVGVGWQWTPAFGLVVGGVLASAVLLWATPVREPAADEDGRSRR